MDIVSPLEYYRIHYSRNRTMGDLLYFYSYQTMFIVYTILLIIDLSRGYWQHFNDLFVSDLFTRIMLQQFDYKLSILFLLAICYIFLCRMIWFMMLSMRKSIVFTSYMSACISIQSLG